jgi:transcriptional regulator with GAF, ATPase, and Fis domain
MKKQGCYRDDADNKPFPVEENLSADPLFLIHHLMEIENLALTEVDMEHMLTTVIENAISLYGAERGMIVLFDECGETLFEASHNLSRADREHPGFEISRAVIEQARRQGEPICLGYAREDSIPFPALCLPLRRNDDVFGLLYLDYQTRCEKCETKSCVFFREFMDFFSQAAYHALKQKQLCTRLRPLEAELRSKYRFESIVGHHPKIIEILKLVAQVAQTDATILIQGESGTGKELIARALHENSHRKDKPLIPVNCGALPEHLLETELFGHVRGAFTGAITGAVGFFESANGGTIFLDEVNDMSPALQVKLLRVLQTGEYCRVGSTDIRHCDVRVIAATSQDLQHLVKERKFREEVYYRLNIVDLKLPALRERKSDIPLLARHFLKLYGTKYGKQGILLSREAEMLLMMYDFPGQIRELENMMQRAVIFDENKTITPKQLAVHLSWGQDAPSSNVQQPKFKVAKQQIVEQFERSYIVECLQATHGNITHAARSSGLHVANLHTKMKKYHINPHTFKL